MFANTNFTRKKMPAFADSLVFDEGGATDPVTCIKAFITNDGDHPPKTLIQLDMFNVPREDLTTRSWEKTCYDLTACMGLLPEDALKLARIINMLVGEIFKEMNHRRG